VPQHGGQGGAHALHRRVGGAHLLQGDVGVGYRRGQRIQQVAIRHLMVEPGERGNGHGTGYLARRMTAHAIGDGEQAGARVRRVLVSFSEEPDVGADRVAECKCHLRSSMTIWPVGSGALL
jgi:hypothetical protein